MRMLKFLSKTWSSSLSSSLSSPSSSSLSSQTVIKYNTSFLFQTLQIEIKHKQDLRPNFNPAFKFRKSKAYFWHNLLQSWTKGWRQIHKIEQNRFFYETFYSWFFAVFYQKTSKVGFWEDSSVFAIKPKHFRDFF